MTQQPHEHQRRAYQQQLDPPPYATSKVTDPPDVSSTIVDRTSLQAGARVLVTMQSCGIPRQGTIDVVSADGSFVWVRLDGIGRILFSENDDVTFSDP